MGIKRVVSDSAAEAEGVAVCKDALAAPAAAFVEGDTATHPPMCKALGEVGGCVSTGKWCTGTAATKVFTDNTGKYKKYCPDIVTDKCADVTSCREHFDIEVGAATDDNAKCVAVVKFETRIGANNLCKALRHRVSLQIFRAHIKKSAKTPNPKHPPTNVDE